jgi:hypothetical protein
MMLKYTFIPVFITLLGGLGWWAGQVQHSDSLIQVETVGGRGKASHSAYHVELVEVMDRIMVHQHYYHSIYGHFTKIINHIGVGLPKSITEHYDVRVTDASNDHLLVTAFSEENGKVIDLISIDQDFQVKSNFQLPPPRSEFLKAQAIRYLRILKDAPSGQVAAEQGVFKGYFKYSLKNDSSTDKTAVAIGVRAPVLGVKLELGQEGLQASLNSPDDVAEDSSPTFSDTKMSRATGQQTALGAKSSEEETQLAQKIFFGEMGRYPKSWSELEEITHLHFESQEIPPQQNEGTERRISSNPKEKAFVIEPITDATEPQD